MRQRHGGVRLGKSIFSLTFSIMDKFINGNVGENERRIQSCSVVVVLSNSFALLSNITIELLWSRRGEVGSQGNAILLRTHVSTFNISISS